MPKLEREIERKLKEMVAKHGGHCLKWVCPGWSGVPDRILLLPGGHVMFVETKRPKGGRRSPMQEWWAKTLKRLSFYHAFVYDEEQVKYLEFVIIDEINRK